MQKVDIELTHCYGIKALKHSFDFSKCNAYAIYAPNGVMKSSLAATFKGAADGIDPEDRVFPSRKSSRRILDEGGKSIEGDRVLVVLPYDEEFGPDKKTSTLLVDATLRKEYEKLQSAIDAAQEALLKAIGKQAGSRRDFELEIGAAFTSNADFELAVTRIRDELAKQVDAPFSGIPFDVIFDDKVLRALDAKDLKSALDSYIKRYNELLAGSTYFRRGTFDYYNAAQIAKSLADNGFFDAKHSVTLKATAGNLEVSNQKELEGVIAMEKEAILKDKELRKNFDAVEKALSKNVELREFCRYLQENEPIVARLANIKQFREDVLKSYLKSHYALYEELMGRLDDAAKRRAEIKDAARKQQTQWQDVISIFNDRFFVPFRLEAKNHIEVMLGTEDMVKLGFTYIDGVETAELEKPRLLEVLSTGERKALYILNVIFEVQRRSKDKQETLIVVDDLADSFDYQNKYAIIQYLKDISEDGQFKLIIMTHNFDFFRTIQSRFIGYGCCLMASKDSSGVRLSKAAGIKNVFANDWRQNFFTDDKKKIASICFLRNLVEMTTGESDPNFLKLTSMLHWTKGTPTNTVGNLDSIFSVLCKIAGSSTNSESLVIDIVEREADSIVKSKAPLGLEDKVVVSVAIRLRAEQFMIAKIADQKFLDGISANQTQALTARFKKQFPSEAAAIRTLDQVALVTPENIHLNSFMYEPILDMSGEHLRKLYRQVVSL